MTKRAGELPRNRTRYIVSKPSSGARVHKSGHSAVGGGERFDFSAAGSVLLTQTMKSTNSGSQALKDPFSDQYTYTGSVNDLIEPPYSFAGLQRLPDESPMLRQCIEAMVTNVEGHGYRLEYIGPDGKDDSGLAHSEKSRILSLLDNANPELSFLEARMRWRRDLETVGNAAYEVCRDAGGDVCAFNHVPFSTIRLTYREKTPVDVEIEVPRDPTDPTKGMQTVKQRRYFRRFVQRVGARTVYFKEFGDPRTIDPSTGDVNEALSPEESATEIVHTLLYSPGTPYGVPRWINQVPSILGSRQSELTNLDFFRENAIPALAVLVSGGKLTQTSIDEIESHISAARGRKSMNRVLVLEAEGDEDAASDDGTIPPPKIDLKPMAGDRQKEGFFLDYGRDCDKKVRSAFRLPPIFVGQSEDYSHATAQASYEVAESQVFGPARRTTDDVINARILRSMHPTYWAVRSNPPRITATEDVIAALQAFQTMGALTPNSAIQMANEYFDLELPEIEEAWGDLPFDLTKLIAQNELSSLKGFDKFVDQDALEKAHQPVAAPGQPPESDGPAPDVAKPGGDADQDRGKGKGKGKAPAAGDQSNTPEKEDAAKAALDTIQGSIASLKLAMAAAVHIKEEQVRA